MKHGGDLLTYEPFYKGKLIDFSSNINPLGPPEGLKEILVTAYDNIHAYPDIQYRQLRRKIAQYLGCQSVEVIVGNGAVDIIHHICMMFEKVIVPYPCFIEYMERPQILGKQVRKIKLDGDFEVNAQDIIPYVGKGDLLILGNPNNPTGRRIKQQVLMELYEAVREKEAFLLLDEVFWEFCQPDYDSIQLFYGSNHVCVIRAATKFFALPGIRLGYGYISRNMAEQYNQLALPWSVNAFADAAGSMIFEQKEYIERSKKYMAEQREYMLNQLKKISNIKIYETHCNYILIKLMNGTEQEVFDHMLKKGIVIRKASSFEGLDSSYIRIAIKGKESNEYLIKCFERYF